MVFASESSDEDDEDEVPCCDEPEADVLDEGVVTGDPITPDVPLPVLELDAADGAAVSEADEEVDPVSEVDVLFPVAEESDGAA